MRALVLPRLAAIVAVAALTGCGSQFELPTEARTGRTIPPDGSYQMLATWTGMDGIQDILLTQGSGSQLFLLFNTGGAGTTPRGSVREYSRTTGLAVDQPFPGLFNPVALCVGNNGRSVGNNAVFVLDQGDTCLARLNPATQSCDTTGRWGQRITQLQYFWRVSEHDLFGAAQGGFTDTTMSFVQGITADDRGGVYISGLAVILLPTTDPRLLERTFEFRVHRYVRGLRSDGTSDPSVLPLGSWHRDTEFEIRQGTGVGSVVEPRGIHWSGTAGPALFVADLGNFRAEKVRDGTTPLGTDRYYHTTDFFGAPALTEPVDVTAEPTGFFFVADAGGQVLRYEDATRSYVQRVDVEPNAYGLPLVRPVAVGADGDLAYVADRGAGQVIRYRRRS
ncbi:MAG: hypothetical protein HOP12_14745 [Candidatus Eisenbacteria bacterium]|uniref:6-bladed beta-propeller n=1 Tax=Eiseniibacteriota bacterium TaxID=2212470 RepID=A0A849SVL0_UNCEI|nr:hypothetical protein [Candidatus Eisenbacteria bacterium]